MSNYSLSLPKYILYLLLKKKVSVPKVHFVSTAKLRPIPISIFQLQKKITLFNNYILYLLPTYSSQQSYIFKYKNHVWHLFPNHHPFENNNFLFQPNYYTLPNLPHSFLTTLSQLPTRRTRLKLRTHFIQI